jgi:hypothetical protein
MKYLILLTLILTFNCAIFRSKNDWFLDCNKCVSEAAEFELIDQTINKHIINPIIIIKNNNRIDTLNLEKSKFEKNGHLGFGDTIISIDGKPGIYSFIIQTKGYDTIKLVNIVVKHVGDPRCEMAATEHFILNLHKIGASKNSDTLNNIQNRHTDTCCLKQ